MTKTIYATFDGNVFIPKGSIDLIPNQRYLIQIEKKEEKPKKKILQRIATRAKDLGISDLAEQHDHYLYGTEKR